MKAERKKLQEQRKMLKVMGYRQVGTSPYFLTPTSSKRQVHINHLPTFDTLDAIAKVEVKIVRDSKYSWHGVSVYTEGYRSVFLLDDFPVFHNQYYPTELEARHAAALKMIDKLEE